VRTIDGGRAPDRTPRLALLAGLTSPLRCRWSSVSHELPTRAFPPCARREKRRRRSRAARALESVACRVGSRVVHGPSLNPPPCRDRTSDRGQLARARACFVSKPSRFTLPRLLGTGAVGSRPLGHCRQTGLPHRPVIHTTDLCPSRALRRAQLNPRGRSTPRKSNSGFYSRLRRIRESRRADTVLSRTTVWLTRNRSASRTLLQKTATTARATISAGGPAVRSDRHPGHGRRIRPSAGRVADRSRSNDPRRAGRGRQWTFSGPAVRYGHQEPFLVRAPLVLPRVDSQ